MKFTKLEEKTKCPTCGMVLASSTNPKDPADARVPREGECGVCAYCATPFVFTDGLKLRRMTDLDMLALPFSELRQLRAAQTAVQRLQRRS